MPACAILEMYHMEVYRTPLRKIFTLISLNNESMVGILLFCSFFHATQIVRDLIDKNILIILKCYNKI